MKPFPICQFGLLVSCTLLFQYATPIWAHSFHISSAEMEFNDQSGKFEVALKLNAVDFAQLLAVLHNRNSSLTESQHASQSHDIPSENSQEISEDDQRVLVDYIAEHFFLSRGELSNREPISHRPEPSKKSAVIWVGAEVEPTAVWCYFELKLPAGDGQLSLTNTVLMNLNKGQTNTAVLISKAGRASFKTTESNFQVALPPYR